MRPLVLTAVAVNQQAAAMRYHAKSILGSLHSKTGNFRFPLSSSLILLDCFSGAALLPLPRPATSYHREGASLRYSSIAVTKSLASFSDIGASAQ